MTLRALQNRRSHRFHAHWTLNLLPNGVFQRIRLPFARCLFARAGGALHVFLERRLEPTDEIRFQPVHVLAAFLQFGPELRHPHLLYIPCIHLYDEGRGYWELAPLERQTF